MQIVLLILIGLSTALIAIWFVFLFRSSQQDSIDAAYDMLFMNTLKIDELRQKEEIITNELKQFDGIALLVMKIIKGGSNEKKIAKLERKNDAIRAGNISKAGVSTLPGHVMRRSYAFVGKGTAYTTLQMRHIELYGKKYAEYRTNGVLAAMCSYAFIGSGIALAFGVLLTAFGVEMIGPAIIVIGTSLPLMVAYSLYDAPRSKANRRRDKIARQFPNVVSKLALLVCSGMIMDRAWKETAYSNDGELYREMRKTSDELGQNIAPEAAYSGFIIKCNTKETSKLASAILQNLSKGNAEIGNLLRELAHDAWQERRHMAKRDAETANSKLLVPTMLLFVSILIMIAVPIFMMMSGAM